MSLSSEVTNHINSTEIFFVWTVLSLTSIPLQSLGPNHDVAGLESAWLPEIVVSVWLG